MVINQEFFKRHIFLIIAAAFMVLVLIVTLSNLSGIKNEGADRESQLNSQYLASQAQLDATVRTIKEQFSIANVKSEKLDTILSDAVKGRYDKDTSAKPGASNALFSALVEAYPDLTGLDTFDKVQDSIASGREAFRQEQTKTLDMLRGYDNWRHKGLIHPTLVSMAGFPSDHLEARIGAKVKHGRAAEEQMFLIVTSSDVQKDFSDGTADTIDFGDQK